MMKVFQNSIQTQEPIYQILSCNNNHFNKWVLLNYLKSINDESFPEFNSNTRAYLPDPLL